LRQVWQAEHVETQAPFWQVSHGPQVDSQAPVVALQVSHAPQTFSVQLPSVQVWQAEQVEAHAPLWQRSQGPAQVSTQMPVPSAPIAHVSQLAWQVKTHLPFWQVSHPRHVDAHVPFWHVWHRLPSHTLPQAPQLAGSLVKSVHSPWQQAASSGVPPQSSLEQSPFARSQGPQHARHCCKQHVKPRAQVLTHVPSWQVSQAGSQPTH
jgi:hypothetical protein